MLWESSGEQTRANVLVSGDKPNTLNKGKLT